MAKPLTIGLVIDDSLDRPDGVQQYVMTLGGWLSSRGHDVHYLTSTTARQDLTSLHVVSKNLGVRFNGNRLNTPLPARRQTVQKLLNDVKFDVLHVQVPYSPVLAGRVMKFASKSTAVIGTFHIFPESKLVELGGKALGLFQFKSKKRFNAMISVSKAAQQFARSILGIDSKVIPNGVDLKRFLPKSNIETESEKLEISFLGRLVERKGCQYLLSAIAALPPASLSKISVKIGGRGPLLDDLKSYAFSHGLSEIVSFVGFVDESDKVAFLQSSDIVALPSTGGESFGISVVEALAACRGVVLAGNNAGYRGVMIGLEDQLISPRDTEQFSKQLDHYINSGPIRRQKAIDQKQAAQQFDINLVGQAVLDEYYSALHKLKN